MKEFFVMGGYGFYIWSSMGIVALFIIFEPFLLALKHRQLIKRIKRQNRH